MCLLAYVGIYQLYISLLLYVSRMGAGTIEWQDGKLRADPGTCDMDIGLYGPFRRATFTFTTRATLLAQPILVGAC